MNILQIKQLHNSKTICARRLLLGTTSIFFISISAQAQNTSIGSLSPNTSATLTIDNAANGEPEALNITGLPNNSTAAERVLMIDGAGNVGSATPVTVSSAGEPWHEVGGTDAATTSSGDIHYDGGRVAIGLGGNLPETDLHIFDADGNGNTGLIVEADSGNRALAYANTADGGFQVDTPAGKRIRLAVGDGGSPDGDGFLHFTNENGRAAKIGGHNGRFGVNTATPETDFHIVDGDGNGNTGLIVEADSGNRALAYANTADGGFQVDTPAGKRIRLAVGDGGSPDGDGFLHFTNENGRAAKIGGHNGRFGVNTATPETDFHIVDGDGNGNTGLIVEADGGARGFIGALANGSVEIRSEAASGKFASIATNPTDLTSGYVRFTGIGAEVYIHGLDGRVGINTQTIPHTLTVDGDAANTTGVWDVISDKRFKQDIAPFSGGLDEVLSFNPVTFTYNDKGPFKAEGETQVGVIAQEVAKIAPYMIEKHEGDYTEDGEYLMLSPQAFPYLLINAIQEQQAIIDTQKAEIKALKNKLSSVSELTQAVAAMQNQITVLSESRSMKVDY